MSETHFPIRDPPPLDRLVEQVFASGEYSSREDVLTVAMELLVQLHKSKHKELESLIREGVESLKSGEAVDLDDDELSAFFDEVKREGRAGGWGRAQRSPQCS